MQKFRYHITAVMVWLLPIFVVITGGFLLWIALDETRSAMHFDSVLKLFLYALVATLLFVGQFIFTKQGKRFWQELKAWKKKRKNN